jgi:hypothetical protein
MDKKHWGMPLIILLRNLRAEVLEKIYTTADLKLVHLPDSPAT